MKRHEPTKLISALSVTTSIETQHVRAQRRTKTDRMQDVRAVERGKQKSLYHHVGHLIFTCTLPSIHTVHTSFTIKKETYINTHLCHSKKTTVSHNKS